MGREPDSGLTQATRPRMLSPGHERQRQAPARWPATLFAVGCPG